MMMFYRAMMLPAMVGALALAHASLAAEPVKASGEPAAGSEKSGAPASMGGQASRFERKTVGLHVAPEALPGPAANRAPAAPSVPGTLRYEFERPAVPSAMAADDFRYGLSGKTVAGPPLKLSTGHPATRTGWQWSGRFGPLRWMSPLDGEGESKLRFGGRVPGQPRLPGMGHFNVGIHYTFE
jgi:hypothetical protein